MSEDSFEPGRLVKSVWDSFWSAVDGNLDVKNRPENEALRKTLLQAPLAFYQKAVEQAHKYGWVIANDLAYGEVYFHGNRAPFCVGHSAARAAGSHDEGISIVRRRYSQRDEGDDLFAARGLLSRAALARRLRRNHGI